jgi:squalene synthase HpnD
MTAATAISPIHAAESAEEALECVKSSGSSFLLGMMALPKARRMGMFGLYAFCRAVDDVADCDWPPELRMAELQKWRQHVDALYEGRATTPVMELLLEPVQAYGLLKEDFIAIIEGMEMDAREEIVLPEWDKLDTYCDHVASAVGRISVRIFGDGSAMAQQVAYHLGRALQLTNILRDIDEDATRGRMYMPREAIEEAGIPPDADLVLVHPALDIAARAVARRAVMHFEEAQAAMMQCDARAMKPARLMRDYYEKILHTLLLTGWQPPRDRVSLGAYEKLALLLKAIF